MAKLQTYKFVNPGIAVSASPVATAARQQTLAFNRLGTTVSSIGSVVKDIEQVSILNNKLIKKNLLQSVVEKEEKGCCSRASSRTKRHREEKVKTR